MVLTILLILRVYGEGNFHALQKRVEKTVSFPIRFLFFAKRWKTVLVLDSISLIYYHLKFMNIFPKN